MISDHADKLNDPAEKSAFLALIKPVVDAAAPYAKCTTSGTGGSERVLQEFLCILRKWIDAEMWFSDGNAYADVVDILRKSNKGNYQHVLEVCRSHGGLQTSTGIVIRIIESIAEAMKTDSNENALVTSVVAGAQSLSDVVPCLSEIGAMSSPSYSLVALKARKLLLQESLPNLEERKAQITNAMKILASANAGPQNEIPADVEKFMNENIPLADVFFPLLKSGASESEKLALVELYLRQMYRTQTLNGFQRDTSNTCVSFRLQAKQSEQMFSSTTSLSSIVELKRRMSSNNLADALEFSDTESEGGDENSNSVSAIEACKLTKKLEDIQNVDAFENVLKTFPQFTDSYPKCPYGPKNVLYFIVLDKDFQQKHEVDEQAKHLEGVLAFFKEQLEEADIAIVSFVFDSTLADDEYALPSIFTFRAQNGYKEDALFRNIQPVNAHQLYLNRLEKNFMVQRLDSRQTSTLNIHHYKATPRSLALEQDKKANKNSRIFVRQLSYILDFSSTSFEKMFVDSLNALDIIVSEHGLRKDNHMFMNLISDYESIVLDPVLVEQTVVNVLKRHGGRISSLGLTEIETRLVCRIDTDSPPIAMRMIASNPTGYVQVMNTYVEAADASSSQTVFKLIGGSKGNLASSGDSSWEGMKISSPYPLTRPFDAQRQAALRASDSLYCYDLPALFEEAVEQQWNYAKENEGFERPLMVTYTSELVVKKKNDSPGTWNMENYLNGELELVKTQRRAGSNDVGMVAWLMTLKTFEYPKVSESILILIQHENIQR